jgi:hypothetical protein
MMMDEGSFLDHDTAWNKVVADAKRARLLDRAGLNIPVEESIRFAGLSSEEGGELSAALIISQIFLFIGYFLCLQLPISRIAGFTLAAIAVGWAIAWYFLNKKLRWKGLVFNVVIFTDKAMYQAQLLPKTGAPRGITRVAYPDIKGMMIERNWPRYHRCKYSAFISTQYSSMGNYQLKLTFETSPPSFKKIVDSIMHASIPVAVQKEQYVKRLGNDHAVPVTSVHVIPASKIAYLRRKQVNDKKISLISIIVFAGLAALFALLSGIFSLNIAVVLGVFLGFGGLVLGFFLVVVTSEYCSLVGFNVKVDTRIDVKDDGIAFTTEGGENFIPFTEGFVAAPIMQIPMLGYVQITSFETKSRPVKLGPVDDFLGLYYDIRERYEKWLEGRNYFIGMESLAEAGIKSDEYMANLMNYFQRGRPFIEQREALIAKKPELDALAQLKEKSMPVPRSLSAIAPDLFKPVIEYLDCINDDESFYLVMHLARPIIKPREVVITADKLLMDVPFFSVSSSMKRVSFDNIRLAEVKLPAPGSSTFKVTLHLMRVDAPEASKIVLKRVPRESPFIALLTNVGKVPVVLK